MNDNLGKNKYLNNSISFIYYCVVVILLLCVYLLFSNSKKKLEQMDSVGEQIKINDINYFNRFVSSNQTFTKLINNNILKIPIQKKNKILFITFDNRKADYIDIHNSNLQDYVNKYGYDYKFITECNYNVYWCKIQLVLEELLNNVYDYVIWLDSDTIIKNSDIDIGLVLNKYNSDIFVGSDNMTKYDLINAGIFVIKNTMTGIEFLQDCIGNVNKSCFNDNGTLKGVWAGTCYEQGQMNIMIADKYFKKTTVLPNDIFLNYSICTDNTFIMHLYASNDVKRKKCFTKL